MSVQTKKYVRTQRTVCAPDRKTVECEMMDTGVTDVAEVA